MCRNFLTGNASLLQIILNKIHHFPLGSGRIFTWDPDQIRYQFNKVFCLTLSQFQDFFSCHITHFRSHFLNRINTQPPDMHFAAPGGSRYFLFLIIQEAGHLMTLLLLHKLRHFFTAALHALRTSSCQRTACLVPDRTGNIPF